MYDEKKQKMRIKYRDTFGGDANKLDAIHDYLAEVNKKWGLVRGESDRLPMPSISLVMNGIDNSKPKAGSWKSQMANWNLTFAERKMLLRV